MPRRTMTVAREAGIRRPTVWRWQQRCAEEDVQGRLRDKTGKLGKASTPADIGRRVVTLLRSDLPSDATSRTGRAMVRRRLRQGVVRSLIDLEIAINRHLGEHNADPKPFTWTATPASILGKMDQRNASVY
jgi:hypothetical protein